LLKEASIGSRRRLDGSDAPAGGGPDATDSGC